MTKYLKHKAGSVEEAIAKQQPVIDSDYQAKFNEAIKEAGKGIGSMTPKEKSDFYSKMEETISERGGANTSSRQGSASRGAKKKYRFGYRVAEKQPKGNDIEEVELTESTDINFNPPVDMNTLKKYGTFSGQFFTLKGNNQRMFAIKKAGKIGTLKITAGNRGQDSDKQVKAMAKDLRYKIIDDGDADYNMKKEDAEHFGISGIETQRPIDEQESKGKVIAKAPGDAASKTGDVETLKQQIGVLRQKLENEKQKAVKPQPNKDTGEVPLTIGVAYKHLKDKKEKEEESKDKKENKKIQTKNKADKQVQEEEVELDEAMPGGANSSSKKGAVWKAWKAAQRKRRKKLNNSALPRQLKDKKKETMVSKNGKTIVIDKSQEKEYLSKGWSLAEDDSNNGRTMTGKPKSKVDLRPKIDYSR